MIRNYSRVFLGVAPGFLLGVHLLCFMVGPVVAESGGKVLAHELRLTRFGDVLSTVMAHDAATQREFIGTALDVMIDAYLIEIRRLDELGAGGDSAKQQSWRAGTLAFVRRLEKSLAAVDVGAEVFIAQEADGAVRFVVDAEQIMLNAPRMADQGALEAALVEQFCLREYCERGRATIEDKTRAQMDSVSGRWEFSTKTKPTYTADDGLQCIFRDQRHLTLKRQACKSLIYELRFLAEAFKALKAKGARVDWNRITIKGQGNAKPSEVFYNTKRQFFHARLPNLRRAEGVLRSAIPWLQARSLGNSRPFVIKPPDIVTYSNLR